jgi:hypothetical protein
LPLVLIRRNLQALLSRNVFYQIVDWASEMSDGESADKAIDKSNELCISSMGQRFVLGNF